MKKQTKKSFAVLSVILLVSGACGAAEVLISNQRPAGVPKSEQSFSVLDVKLEGVTSCANFEGYKVLVYDGGEDAIIQRAMLQLGITDFDLRTPGNPVTQTDLATHDILVVGWNKSGDMSGLNPDILAAGITGNILLTGHDADWHVIHGYDSGSGGDAVDAAATKFLSQAISFSLIFPGTTGLVALGDSSTAFSYLPEEWEISAVGNLYGDSITSFTQEGLSSGVFDGLTPADMSEWGNSYHTRFTSWDSNFVSFELGGTGEEIITIARTKRSIALTKVDDVNDGECVGLGDEVNYTISYNYPIEPNVGNINDVSIIDELPEEVEFISSDSNGTYDQCSHAVRWHIGTLEPGESVFVTLKVTVRCAETASVIRNYCKITSGNQILGINYEDTPKCNASDPSPADNAADMPADVVLSWRPGPKADKHDVYFGTDESSVAEANRSNPSDVLLGLNQNANTFDPCGLLELNKRYYWRIDEVNDANIWKGCVWSFTTHSPQSVEIIGSWTEGVSHAEEPGTNRALLLMAHAEEAGAISLDSVTYGGQEMTKIIDVNVGTTSRVYVAGYILDEAGITAAADSNFAFTWSTTPDREGYGSVFLQNVDQTDPIGFVAQNGTLNGSTISTYPLPTYDGDMVIDAATNSNTGFYTVLNGFTEGLQLTITSADAVEGYKPATGVDETPSVYHYNPLRQVLIGFVVQRAAIFIDCGEVLAAGYGLTSDLDGDCYVDYQDLNVIRDCWLNTDCAEPDNCGCADFEPTDGVVDLFDFSDFALQWLWCNDPEDANCMRNWP